MISVFTYSKYMLLHIFVYFNIFQEFTKEKQRSFPQRAMERFSFFDYSFFR